jgi:tetratricopeptide (TPR) repeat protein
MLRTQLVQAYLSSGRLEQAERALTEALRSNRKDSDALIQRAEIYLRRNRLADAGQDLSQALKSQPDSALAHWVMSQLNRVQGHSLNQRQELTNALRLDPHLLGARVELSRNLIASKAASSALDVLEQAPADQKKLPLYLVERNAALLALGDLVRLRKGIDEGLALGRHPDLLLQDGILRIKTRDFNRARRSLEEALRLNPNDLRIPETIALSYVAEQRKPAALAALRQYAAAHPKSAGAHSLVGRWLFQSGDAAAARASFEAAAALDPGHVEAGEALAEMDLKDGKFDAARSRLHTLLASNPQNAQLRLLLASAEEKAGNSQAALAQYRQILSADAHHVIALNNLAYGLAGTQPDEALRLAQQARELAPNSAAVEETLGWALYQKGLYQPAVRYLESAVKRQPTPRGQYHLALAYRKLGNLRQSDESLKAALRLDPSMPEAQAARELLERSTR